MHFSVLLLFLALGRYGDIKLGSDEEEPEFKLGSWIALLFTSGIGIGIVFLGVAEPLSHFLSPIGEYEKVRTALFLVFSLEHQCLGYLWIDRTYDCLLRISL